MKAGKSLIIYKTVVVASYQPANNCNLYTHSRADLGGVGSMGSGPPLFLEADPPFSIGPPPSNTGQFVLSLSWPLSHSLLSTRCP